MAPRNINMYYYGFSSVHELAWICFWCYLVASDTRWYTIARLHGSPYGLVWYCREHYFVLVWLSLIEMHLVTAYFVATGRISGK